MKQKKISIILPVENQVRELDSKLLFGCFAVERGYDVVIGSRSYVSYAMTKLPRGIFVAKSMRPRSAFMLNIIQGLGHMVVAWDEESLVRFESDEYNNWRFSDKTFSPIDLLFAWGEDDAKMFNSYEGLGGIKVHVTGNPRIDLLRNEFREIFSEQVDAIRLQYGKFILINTNFSFVNAFVQDLNLLAEGGSGPDVKINRTGEGMSKEFASGMFGHQKSIADAFVSLLSKFALNKPMTKFILRPHPSENHEFWRTVVKEFSNIEVAHEGNVVPWILASEMLIHNGCTTAVEATVLGKPVIAYQPISSQCYDYHLPNGLSLRAGTEPEVLELIDMVQANKGEKLSLAKNELLKKHLESSDGLFASERILNIIDSNLLPNFREKKIKPTEFMKAWLLGRARTTVKKINSFRRGHRNSKMYHDHRFPAISVDELQERVRALDSVLGRFNSVKIASLSENLFLMERDC